MAVILPRLRLCPACTRRDRAAEIVDPHCPVCEGQGVLKLGAAGLHYHTPETIGEAVLLTLEAYARAADQALTLSDDRLGALREALQALHHAGLLGHTDTPTGAITQQLSPTQIASRVSAESTDPIDRVLTTAEPHHPGPEERTGAQGLPALSRHGHPSSLARITNPADPYRSTRKDAGARDRQHREARAIAQTPRRKRPRPPTLTEPLFTLE